MRTSLAAALAHWDGREALWVFGYGSLIWKPEFEFDARMPAQIFGFHRRLCLRSVRYRGSEDCPGVVAGLDRGGSCYGVAYRMAPALVERQFVKLWEREMFLGSYAPKWVRGRLCADGAPVRALAFVVRRSGHNYCGGLDESALIDILSRACGVYGTSLDYLERTVAALHELGLRDAHLEGLMHRARRHMQARDCRQARVDATPLTKE